jgi:hypothetical protein
VGSAPAVDGCFEPKWKIMQWRCKVFFTSRTHVDQHGPPKPDMAS